MEDENDSDKENKDPSSIPILQLTPSSKKRRGKRRKDKGIANHSALRFTYPLELDEVILSPSPFLLAPQNLLPKFN
jgi:hypothetical protein